MIFKNIFGGKPAVGGDYVYLMQKGDYVGALVFVEKALKADPQNIALVVRKAECHERLGQTDPAVAALEKAIQLYTEDGFLAKAIALQKKIAALKPGTAEHTSQIIAVGVQQKRREKAWQLKAIPSLFADFDREELNEIIHRVDLRTYPEAEVIFQEGDPGTTLLCITSGHVSVSCKAPDGRDVPLQELGPGDFFGEVGFLTGKPRTATVKTLTPVEILVIPKERMDEIIVRFPHVQKVMDDFRQRRAQDTVNAMIRQIKEGKGPEA
jgi:hypothetical protein